MPSKHAIEFVTGALEVDPTWPHVPADDRESIIDSIARIVEGKLQDEIWERLEPYALQEQKGE